MYEPDHQNILHEDEEIKMCVWFYGGRGDMGEVFPVEGSECTRLEWL